MSLKTMQRARLDNVTPDVYGNIMKQTETLDGVTVTKVTFKPGAKWSVDLKEKAGTDSCRIPHVAYVIEGGITIQMDDGSVETFSEGDVMMLPPGHDAWTDGEIPCVFVEFSHGADYYSDQC